MAAVLFQFLASAAVIVVAGTFLARYGDAIADLTGLGRLLVGSVLMAAATSLPELTVDLNAIRLGMPDLAVAGLMGACLCNLLILAVADLMHRSRRKMFSHASAAHSLSAAVSIALVAIAAVGILIGSRLPYEFLGIGVGPWVVLISYIGGVRLIYFDQRYSAGEAVEGPQDVRQPAGETSLAKALIFFALAAATIFMTGPFLAESAGDIAEMTGLGETFVGTALVAICTTLPELVATVAAVRMGAFDLAVGNVFGSNAINMALLAPIDAAHSGSLLAVVDPTNAITALYVIVVTTVAITGQIYQVEKRRRIVEPDATLVAILVVGAMASLYYLR